MCRTSCSTNSKVGNQEFADYVDSKIGSFTRITNLKDPVPIVPGRFLGYHHPSNEAHISEDGSWKSCAGQDNENTECSVGDTPNIFDGDVGNHSGELSNAGRGIRVFADCRKVPTTA